MQTLEYLNYDENVDHLTIYKANEEIVANIDSGLVILSLNKKKEIMGIEFMGAHKNFNLPLTLLEHLESCKVSIKYIPHNKMIIITVQLKAKDKESPIVFSSHTNLGNNPFESDFKCSASV